MSDNQLIAGRYALLDLIGAGAMGDVYKATDSQTDDIVAIKILKPEVVRKNPDMLNRFRREGEALRQLNHPNIVKMFDAVEEHGRHYIIMEYVSGGDLKDYLDEHGQLSVERSLEIAVELADALSRAHHLGIIHRDIKPANVLIAADGTPRLTDFGVAHIIGEEANTREGTIVGSYAYLSPEVFEGKGVDARSDIWSFGILLYEMLAGKRPFTAPMTGVLIAIIINNPAPSLSSYRDDLPDSLIRLVERMLTKDWESRIASVRLVGAEIEAIMRGTPLTATPLGILTSAELMETKGGTARHNLPPQPTEFIGRKHEVAVITQLMEQTRLLTLLGPGGTGKTRLSQQAALALLDSFPNGITFINLSSITDPERVIETIGETFEVIDTPENSLFDGLIAALSNRKMLLLLDNFEQVVGAGPLIGELLVACPDLSIMITSRESLRIAGEQEYPVPPLRLPHTDRPETLEQLAGYTAIKLFIARARALKPAFVLTEENAPAIAEICIRLDGMPLAIELAAARIRLMTPQTIYARLDDRFKLLSTGSRDLPARQQTLRGMIDWSYNLLNEEEKRLFARLAVFQGGRTLEAIEAICGPGLSVDVLDALESLVVKSMVRQEESLQSEIRFVLLESIYAYAHEQLEASGESEDIRKRHADYFLSLAEQADESRGGEREHEWVVELHIERDNLRAAHRWMVTTGETEMNARLINAMSVCWLRGGQIAEGWRWTESAIEQLDSLPVTLRSGFLWRAAYLAYTIAEHEKGLRWARQGIEFARQQNDTLNLAWSTHMSSNNLIGDPDSYDEAEALAKEALSLFRDLGNQSGMASTLNLLGEYMRLREQYDEARQYYEECIAVCRETGELSRVAMNLHNIGLLAYNQGDYQSAYDYAKEGIGMWLELENQFAVTYSLFGIFAPLTMLGEKEKGAMLLGGLETIIASEGIVFQTPDQIQFDRSRDDVREFLGDADFQAFVEKGRGLSSKELLGLVLGDA